MKKNVKKVEQVKKLDSVKEKIVDKEVFSMQEANDLVKEGYIIIEIKSGKLGIRPKTWILRKEN